MASERILQDGEEWVPSPTGDHITLPLDAAQLDDAAVGMTIREYWGTNHKNDMDAMRAAIAAYANHVAGGGA